jgi:hypothetical protein
MNGRVMAAAAVAAGVVMMGTGVREPEVVKERDALGAWMGSWRGPAEVIWADGRVQKLEMGLDVARTEKPERLTWAITYITPAREEGGTENRQVRPYELVVVDAAKGQYEVDEKNGIVIPTSLIGGAFYSCFTVQGNQIAASYRLNEAGRVVIELVTTDAQRPSTTGDAGGVPPVIVLRTRSVQRAVLERAAP